MAARLAGRSGDIMRLRSHTAPAQALILAAGRGERMRPLTDATPKPMLLVQGQPLLAWHLAALQAGGCQHALINTAWLGDQIDCAFGQTFSGNAQQPAMQLSYSHEERDFGGALETGGGIVRALPHLSDVFWVVAGDIHAPDFTFDPRVLQTFAQSPFLAHLWLVPNPAHHPQGDFGLSPEGLALNLATSDPHPRFTFSTIALYRADFFVPPQCELPAGNPQGIKAPLAPWLRRAMDDRKVSASLYTGRWTDVGTPQRLAELNAEPGPTAQLKSS
jgi:MurNAc alpha-1-phosphate uridylyltransferase